jgi:transposase
VPQPEETLEGDEVVHSVEGAAVCTCGCEMSAMTGGFEESSEIHVTERKYVLRRYKRQKYVCKGCNRIVAAPGPTKLTPGGEFSIHMGVQVADDKYHHHVPLSRQARQMALSGLKVEPKTLFGLTAHLESLLRNVPGMIKAEILSRPWVAIDETRMKIISTKTNGHVWALANNYGTYYQYETTRSGQVAREMLRGFRGSVISDAFSGYDFLEGVPEIVHTFCWSHLRRKLFECKATYPEAVPAIELIDELYGVEREAETMEQLEELRPTKSAEILARFDAYLDSRRGLFLSSGAFGKAVEYYDKRREEFSRFVQDANIPLDSNAVERSLRDAVMGRKNFLGFRTINGADVGMTFYTIIRTCRLLGLSPKSYMLVMAVRAARSEKVLTPYQWGTELAEKAKAGLKGHELFKELSVNS